MLSYRWFALGVGFGRSDWQWFRVNNVGPRPVLVSGLCLAAVLTAPGERVVAQNPKISRFRENQVSSRGSISGLISCAKPPNMTMSPKCGRGVASKKRLR